MCAVVLLCTSSHHHQHCRSQPHAIIGSRSHKQNLWPPIWMPQMTYNRCKSKQTNTHDDNINCQSAAISHTRRHTVTHLYQTHWPVICSFCCIWFARDSAYNILLPGTDAHAYALSHSRTIQFEIYVTTFYHDDVYHLSIFSQ